MRIIAGQNATRRAFILGTISAGVFFFSGVSTASAATLSISPASATHTVGETFTLSVRVSSANQAMNAASGVVNFPTDLLQVMSLSKSSSIMNLWVQEPTFSNSAGTVNFEGVVLNPGFAGSGGNVLGITFRAKRVGDADLTISSGTVLANDGNGTEILTGTSGSSITIESAPEPAKPSPKAPVSPETTAGSSLTGLQAPIITHVTSNVAVGDMAEVLGSSIYPEAVVRLVLQMKGGVPVNLEGAVGGNGIFSITRAHDLPPGDYTGSAFVEKDGAQSPPSDSFIIHFDQKSLFVRIGELLSQPEVILAFSIILAFILGILVAYLLFRRDHKKQSLNAVLHNIDVEVHRAFLALRAEVNEAIEEMREESTKRALTTSETKFIHKMTDTIKSTEQAIDKDIQKGAG